MVSGSHGFVCVLVEKKISFDKGGHAHREEKDKELHEEMDRLTPAAVDDTSDQSLFAKGGAVRTVGSDLDSHITVACVGDFIAAFQGQLTNFADLCDELGMNSTTERTRSDGGSSVKSDGQSETAHTPAELVIHLYRKHGAQMIGNLRSVQGYAFAMYDSKQGRVLAARDSTGRIPLAQARTPAGSLVLASNMSFLSTCSELVEFGTGDFKYGWSSPPRHFDPMEFLSTPQLRNSCRSQVASRRSSLEGATGSHPVVMAGSYGRKSTDGLAVGLAAVRLSGAASPGSHGSPRTGYSHLMQAMGPGHGRPEAVPENAPMGMSRSHQNGRGGANRSRRSSTDQGHGHESNHHGNHHGNSGRGGLHNGAGTPPRAPMTAAAAAAMAVTNNSRVPQRSQIGFHTNSHPSSKASSDDGRDRPSNLNVNAVEFVPAQRK